MAVSNRIKIKLKAFEHQILDQSSKIIVDAARSTGASVSGPVPLPTKKKIITILRATHKYKDSMEQFQLCWHKRLIVIKMPSQKTMESLMKLQLPAGVEIEIQVSND